MFNLYKGCFKENTCHLILMPRHAVVKWTKSYTVELTLISASLFKVENAYTHDSVSHLNKYIHLLVYSLNAWASCCSR